MSRFRALWIPLLMLLMLSVTLRESERRDQVASSSPRGSGLLSSTHRTMTPVNGRFDPKHAVTLPFILTDGNRLTLHLRPSRWLPANFRIALGSGSQTLAMRTHAWQGYAFNEGRRRGAAASMITVGDHACAIVLLPSGETLTLPLEPGKREVAGWRTAASHGHQCTIAHHDRGGRALASLHVPSDSVQNWQTPFFATLEAASQGGFEPGTGLLNKYVDPIPMAEGYALSLKDFSLLLVLDKHATGANDPDSLAKKASQWLATVANVATVYENQLGIRLTLQELMMIPEDPAFADVQEEGGLADFIDWLKVHRPRQSYAWNTAFKVGQGLSPSELGIAYVGSVGRNDSVGMIRATTGWDTLAHELGHSLGANHTDGGIMNQRANGGGDRSFFSRDKDNSKITAAQLIYQHSQSRLGGDVALRDPQESPFARNDFRQTPLNTAVRFDPLANDLRSVLNGRINTALHVEEIGPVTPPHAGRAQREHGEVVFAPSPGYIGAAWFSYSLRGNIGNNGQGWLHKGDVSILVGDPAETPFNLTLAPGEVLTFFPDTSRGDIRQPGQALVQWLPDTNAQMLIRVNADAAGTDTFSINSQPYQIVYRESPIAERSAVYWQHPQSGPRRFFIGRGMPQSGPWIGDSVQGEQPPFFPGNERLISAKLSDPAKGTLEVLRSPVTVEGRSTLLPTGELRFTPDIGASGTAIIQYVVEDSTGTFHNGTISIHLIGESETLVATNAAVRYWIPHTDADAARWMLNAFQDRSWPLGALPIGYEDGRGYEEFIRTDVSRQMSNVNGSIYLRIPFTVDDPDAFTDLILRVRLDDGLVAYLNGREILRENTPEVITWSSTAKEGREAGVPIDFDISDARELLFRGENLLALHGLNATKGSSDFLIMPELLGLTSPRLATTGYPRPSAVSLPVVSGIVFRSARNDNTLLPVSGDITTTWQVVQAPGYVPVRIEAGPEETAMFFPTSGTYRVRMTATDGTEISTQEHIVVRVGESLAFDHKADGVDAGPDIVANQTQIELGGEIIAGVPGFQGRPLWSQVSGPGEAGFSPADALSTRVTLPGPGRYRLRLHSISDEITVFDDIIVSYKVAERTLIGARTAAAYWVPAQPVDDRWKQRDFTAAGWRLGVNGIGYDTSGNYASSIATDIQEAMQFRHSSLYIRYPFQLESVGSVDQLKLVMRADDGYVVYLNGREVLRQNAALTRLTSASTAVQPVDEQTIINPLAIDITEYASVLLPGSNVLAVHALNHSASSTDFLIDVTLTATMAAEELAGSFERWITSFTTLPIEAATPGGDWDRDGVINLVEYALGTSPIERDAQLAWSLEASDDPDAITVSHQQRSDLSMLGGAITIETSVSLAADDWRPWPAHRTETVVLGNGLGRTAHHGPKQGAKQFFRLHVAF